VLICFSFLRQSFDSFPIFLVSSEDNYPVSLLPSGGNVGVTFFFLSSVEDLPFLKIFFSTLFIPMREVFFW